MMGALIAHAGGWDELLLAAAIVLAFLLPSLWRNLRRRREHQRGTAATCPYCGAALPAVARRCEACGFRVPGR